MGKLGPRKTGKLENWKVRPRKIGKLENGKIGKLASCPRKSVYCRYLPVQIGKCRRMGGGSIKLNIYIYINIYIYMYVLGVQFWGIHVRDPIVSAPY